MKECYQLSFKFKGLVKILMNASCTKNGVVSVSVSVLTNQVATLVSAQMVTVWLPITAPVKVVTRFTTLI